MAKKILAIVLSMVMCFSMLQLQVFAVDNNQVMDGYYTLDEQGNITGTTAAESNSANGFTVSKTIAQTGLNQFNITLKVITSQEVIPSDAAIQLVIDTSISMNDCAEGCGSSCKDRSHSTRLEAVKSILNGFLDSLIASNSGKIYVSVIRFGQTASTVCEWVDIKNPSDLDTVKKSIKNLEHLEYATNMHAGLILARNRLGMDKVANTAAKFTVLLSDGAANCTGKDTNHTNSIALDKNYATGSGGNETCRQAAQNVAAELNNKSSVFAVGYGIEKAYLNSIINNESNVFVGTGTADVGSAFANIAQSAVNGMNGAGSTVTDPMGEFIVMGNISDLSGKGVSAADGTLTWKLDPSKADTSVSGNVTTYTYEIEYPITLNTAGDGFQEKNKDGSTKYYPANGYTFLSVPTENGTVEVPFNIPAVCGELPIYTVSYQYTGTVPAGAPAVPGSANYKKTSTVTVAAEPTLANYTFSGWATSDAVVTDGSFQMPGANVTLVGSWIEHNKYDYSVTYNANFGEDPATAADEENISNTYSTAHSIEVNENTFSRVNYTFTGWNTEADGSGTPYTAEDAIGFTPENNTLVLFAQWQENPKYDYSVTYNANFGEDPATADDEENLFQVYDTSKSITVDENTFSRANHTFIGWSETKDGQVIYSANDVLSFSEGGEKTLYAQWIEHDKYSYTVIYNGNGGTLSDEDISYGDSENLAETYATSHSITVDGNTFSREHYSFAGWNTKADGTGTLYTAEEVIALTAQNNTKTLYAQWIEHNKYDYSVTYNANFGEDPATAADEENLFQVYDTSKSITVDENTFVRENYDFLGWALDAEGEVVYQAGEQISFTEGGSEELFAVWQEHPKYDYIVNYNANFGEDPATAADEENLFQVYDTSKSITVDENSFVRENYTFIGWSETKNGEVIYSANDVLTFIEGGEKTLYAQWIEHDKYSYTVIYNGNGGTLSDEAISYGDSENLAETYATSHSITVDENTFSREHYSFAGWNTEADGTGTPYTAEEVIALTAQNNTKTLYAQWTLDNVEYTVEYKVKVDDQPYKDFTGELPEGAPTGGEVPYGTEPEIVPPASITDDTYTYDFIKQETVGDKIIVYYSYETPEPEPETKPANVEYTVEYKVQVDDAPYEDFTGELPEGAPTGGEVPYGTEPEIVPPASITDDTYTYDFTKQEIVGNKIIVYYSFNTPETEPIVEIPEEEVPLAPAPEVEEELVEIPDEKVPLANVPQTGDTTILYAALTTLSGLGLAALGLKKKEEDTEA